jgi:hypothetical protein
MTLADHFSSAVVGVTFVDTYPANLLDLHAVLLDRIGDFGDEPLPVILVRNPDNEHDPNAIEVHVPAVGMVGHLPAPLAAWFAPALDAGERWAASVEAINVHPSHPDRPGLTIEVHRAP